MFEASQPAGPGRAGAAGVARLLVGGAGAGRQGRTASPPSPAPSTCHVLQLGAVSGYTPVPALSVGALKQLRDASREPESKWGLKLVGHCGIQFPR